MELPYGKLSVQFAILSILCHILCSSIKEKASFWKKCYIVSQVLLAKMKFYEEYNENMLDRKAFMPSLEPRKKHRVAERGGGLLDAAATDDSLIPGLPDEIALQILSRTSRSEHPKLACVNKKFKSLIANGYLYKLRKQLGVVEYWVYLVCSMSGGALDFARQKWIKLPEMPEIMYRISFPFKESLAVAVGTEILRFDKQIMRLGTPEDPIQFPIWAYSLLTHGWSSCHSMNTPRSWFAFSSQGHILVVAGGIDIQFGTLKSAEIYNSETHIWESLPDMNVPRHSSSGFFMDGRFYVIGGTSTSTLQPLTCGEEYNFETRTWRKIDGMYFNDDFTFELRYLPPLVSVVKNQLYAADKSKSELMKYDKTNNAWRAIGRLPVDAKSRDFKSCGDMLLLVCGRYKPTLYTCCPENDNSGSVEWSVISCKDSFTDGDPFNCVVLGC